MDEMEHEENPFCAGCGEPVRNGLRLAGYDGHLWHSLCAVVDRSPRRVRTN